jgi:DNA-binding NarL/FixJ family response regulator
MSVPVRLVVVDDQLLLLAVLCELLDGIDGIQVVAATAKPTEVLSLVHHHRADVLLLDITMPEMDGWAVLEQVAERAPWVKTILFSALADSELLGRARELGAVAVVNKAIEPSALAPLVCRVAAGEVMMQPELCMSAPVVAHGLTERELEILLCVAGGLANDDVARQLDITAQTVKFHLTQIYQKLGVKSRTAAARFAFDNGLVSLASS